MKVKSESEVTQSCPTLCDPMNCSTYVEYIMQNAGLDEAQAGIKIARRNINNLRYAGEGNGNPLWYSCLGNPMDGGAW